MQEESELRLDRSKLEVVRLQGADEADRNYWLSKTPLERLEAMEQIRQVIYGYDPATDRLQRVLEVVKRK